MPRAGKSFVLVVRRAIPELDLRVNDVISFNPNRETPLHLCRRLPHEYDRVAVATALTGGALKAIEGQQLAEILALLGSPSAPPPPPIDVEAALADLARPASPGIPTETLGSRLLHGEALNRWSKTRGNIRRQKICRTCQHEFVGKSNRAVYCDTCRQSRRAS
jgi:hypothetical protein